MPFLWLTKHVHIIRCMFLICVPYTVCFCIQYFPVVEQEPG